MACGMLPHLHPGSPLQSQVVVKAENVPAGSHYHKHLHRAHYVIITGRWGGRQTQQGDKILAVPVPTVADQMGLSSLLHERACHIRDTLRTSF